MKNQFKQFQIDCYDKKQKKWSDYQQIEIQYPEDSDTECEIEFELKIEEVSIDIEKLRKDRIAKVENKIEEEEEQNEKISKKDVISKVEQKLQLEENSEDSDTDLETDDSSDNIDKCKICVQDVTMDVKYEEMNYFRNLVHEFTQQGNQQIGLICGNKSKKSNKKGRQSGSNNIISRIEKKNSFIIKDTQSFLQKLQKQYPNNTQLIHIINGGKFTVVIDNSFQRQILQLTKDLHFDSLKDNEDQIDRQLKSKKLWKGFYIMKQKLITRFNKVYDFSNVQNILTSFKISVQAVNIQGDYQQFDCQGETIEQVVQKLLDFLRRYQNDFLEFPVYNKNNQKIKNEQNEIQSIKANFLITPQMIRGGLIKGQQFFENIKDFIVISPYTKKQCVAQCISIALIYQEKSNVCVNMYQRIQKLQEQIVQENNIKDGVEIENLQEILLKYDIQLITELETEVEQKNQYCLVMDGHCQLILKKDAKSQYIFESIKQKHKLYQRPMKQYIPSIEQLSTKIGLLTYDLEWITDRTNIDQIEQYEYAWGTYNEVCGYISNISDNSKLDNIIENFQQTFVDNLYYNISQMKEETIIVCGHNSFKCDLPRVLKTILGDKRFSKSEESCQSGSTQISHPFDILDLKKKIIITDFINLQQTSLDKILKRFKCKLQKGSVKHEIITVDNVQEQIISQNINEYLRTDCEGLHEAYNKYRDQVRDSTRYEVGKGKKKQDYYIDILNLKVFTSPSLAIKIFLSKFYNPELIPIFNPTDIYQEFCKKSYHGGLSSNFRQGIFENVTSIDINSSYPSQMVKPIPSGPQYFQLFNCLYIGQPLKFGVYECIVKYTPPNLKFPCICIEEDGKLLNPILTNYTVHITHEVLEKSLQQGYEVYIVRACLTDIISDCFYKFIMNIYNQRVEVKKQMKIIEKQIKSYGNQLTEEQQEIVDELWNQYYSLDSEQELLKLLLNSTYGKFAWWLEHDISNQLTSNKSFLLQELAKGNISDITNINDNYVMYSGVSQSSMKNSNFMISSYITSRGRLQLIEMLELLDSIKGIEVIYGDTDSVYYNILPNFDQVKYNEIILPMCDNNKLGYWKIEKENQRGVFICSKNYGLQDKETLEETIKGKGICRYLIENEQRRLYEGQKEEINFNWLVQLYESKGQGKVFTKMQTFVQKNLLEDSNYTTICKTKQVQTRIMGTISKSIVSNSGVCIPLRIQGESIIQYETEKNETLRFSDFDQMKNYFKMEIADIFDKYCTVQIEASRQYIVIIDKSKIQEIIEYYGINKLHQMFGNYICPVIDIDCQKKDYFGKDFKYQVNCLKKQVCQILDIPLDEMKITDRSREDKYSYHLYVPGKLINRQSFNAKMQQLQLKETKYVSFEGYSQISYSEDYLKQKDREPTGAYYIDTQVYRKNGSLRISSLDMYYQPNFPQIQIHTDQDLTKLKETEIRRQELKMSKQQSLPIKKQVMQFLEEKNIKGWTFNECKQIKGQSICYFKRGKQADKHCKICNKNHDKDNNLIVRIKGTTQQTFEIGCTKYQFNKQ